MVIALWYRPSGWLERLRLLRGRFKGKGAVGGEESISGCGLARDHTPRPGLKPSLVVVTLGLDYGFSFINGLRAGAPGFGGMRSIAYSASAAIVSVGFIPGFAGMIDPSTTYSPG
jgi:hypothetical protein